MVYALKNRNSKDSKVELKKLVMVWVLAKGKLIKGQKMLEIRFSSRNNYKEIEGKKKMMIKMLIIRKRMI